MSERRILFVCTANICRSPTAELLARHRFGEDRALFRSAGFLAGGRPSPPDLQHVLSERGLSVVDHRSHELDPETVDAAELILTMESRHVQEITVRAPAALDKSIPLRQAAELATEHRFDDLLAMLPSRDLSDYLTTKWDVDDPYGRGRRRYRRMVDEVDELVARAIGGLLSMTPGPAA